MAPWSKDFLKCWTCQQGLSDNNLMAGKSKSTFGFLRGSSEGFYRGLGPTFKRTGRGARYFNRAGLSVFRGRHYPIRTLGNDLLCG